MSALKVLEDRIAIMEVEAEARVLEIEELKSTLKGCKDSCASLMAENSNLIQIADDALEQRKKAIFLCSVSSVLAVVLGVILWLLQQG